MSRVIAPEHFYHVGGDLSADAPSYVQRNADRELFKRVAEGDFCYVLMPRQIGKSSLMVRTASQLKQKRIRSVIINLQGKTERGMVAEAFYPGLLDAFIRQLDLPVKLTQWWQEHALLSAVQRFSNFAADEVLPRVEKKLVVFIDEIDRMLDLDFSDDFFAAVRAFYNERARNPAFKRLTFVLLGVASPQDLIKDRARSPFNIGYRINLLDFTFDEARKLARGFPLDVKTAEQLLERVLYWTGGHPYLTQKVCASLATAKSWHPDAQRVDKLIDTLFFSDEMWSDPNLADVRNRIVEDKDNPEALLELYRRIRSGEQIFDDERSPVHASLKLSGIVKVIPGGILRPRNSIYERVFDLAWVDTTLRVRASKRAAHTVAQGKGAVATSGSVAASQGGVAVGRDVHGNVYVGVPTRDPTEALAIYRRVLVEGCRSMSLRGLDVGASDPTGAQQRFDLAQVYVDLLTTTQVPVGRTKKRGREQHVLSEERETRRLSVLEAVIDHRRVVLLGDPGSGKSTFLTHLALCLAGQSLEPQRNWLQRLPGWQPQEADVVPALVTLRDFARWLPEKPQKAQPQSLWKFITDRLEAQNLAFVAEPLQDRLERGQVILLLDGLDEIPNQRQRTFIRDAVAAFAGRNPQDRIIVTCRTLSYQDPAWQLPDFESITLVPFSKEQIDRFIAAWYGELARLGSIKPGAVEGVTRHLREAVRRPDLWRLASNPLLLTAMALIHTHKGRLPEARALLYEETVDILLWRWEQLKVSGEDELPRLRSLLTQADRTDVDLRRALWQLAFEAHRKGGTADTEAVADIGELQLHKTLIELHPDKSRDWARQVVEVMKLRSGLLLERVPQVYTFPHRTFQEYLAGAHLSAQPDFAQRAAQLVAEGALWREVVLLAVGRLVYLNGDTAKPLALVAELCPMHQTDTEVAWRQTWLAGDALLEIGLNRVQDSALGRELAERMRHRLTDLLSGGHLSPVERAGAGNTLAHLGDPRFDPKTWYLPKEQLLGFVEIPEGPFRMGSDPKPDKEAFEDEFRQHKIDLPRYYIGRYPVTVGQFQAFVKDSGYKPKDENCLHGLPNHPVVNVAWHDALAYCNWLTEQLKKWKETPEPLKRLLGGEGWRITLPSEAQWEKAARGGKHLSNGATNPNPGRIYPWDDEFDPNKANTDETKIGSTSAVGCFPDGASPYGLLDMSGNVWEWTGSLWGKDWQKPEFGYPYDPKDGRESLEASDKVLRVLRGGSFLDGHGLARCANRYWYDPHYGHGDFGFRVVASPF